MVCRCLQFNVCNGVAMYVCATAAMGSCAICWADLPLNLASRGKMKAMHSSCTLCHPTCVSRQGVYIKHFKTSRVPPNEIVWNWFIQFRLLSCPSYVLPVCKLNSCLWFANLHQHALARAARLLYMKHLPVSSLSLNSQVFMCSKSVCIWTSGRRI